ncbi:hypothetical protein PVAG01_05854 [Phlyctema vagabunda]|uniref:Zn(2)-C6 fungal-type domain-containing protein n=1 Tax=Phlyctema vagabunda TaxID=108571 RepID=A0ABR4PEE5_9HELO
MTSTYRRACDGCQLRHLKCNLVKPCSPCSQAGRTCRESSKFQFRHDDNPAIVIKASRRQTLQFREDQRWLTVPGELEFILETAESISAQDEDPNSNIFDPTHTTSVVTVDDQIDETASSGLLLRGPNPDGIDSAHSRDSVSLWPLPVKDEAFLMRYFVDKLSPWVGNLPSVNCLAAPVDSIVQFDYCDKEKHFSSVVVQAAATSPTLQNAILAVSAKFLSVTQDFDRFAPDKYQHECLRTLIPALTAPEAVLDENLFAATVILRFFEEMTGSHFTSTSHFTQANDGKDRIDGLDTATHILGSHMLVKARERARSHTPLSTSSLRTATLIVELRQEIHIAFMTNRPPPPLTEYCGIEHSIDAADDWTWTKRVVAHTAEILTYCNGDGYKHSERWKELWAYLDAWEAAIPPSFNPIYEEGIDHCKEQIFPTLWFANDCHAAGGQYLAISRILLLANDPRISSLGSDRIVKQKVNEAKIKTHVRIICGIAVSNMQFFPTMLAAGVTIAMCGERFTDHREQEALIAIVTEAEAHVAWPSLKARERLIDSWGWDSF